MVEPAPERSPGIAEDYDALRYHCGAVWRSRDFVRLHGLDAPSYLQGQCSQDVVALEVGASADALILNPQGKIDALVRVTRTAPEDFVLDVDGGYGGAVVERLERFKLRVKVEIERLAWRCLALRGPDAVAAGAGAPRTGSMPPEPALRIPVAWGGAVGIDFVGPAPAVPDGIRVCAVEAWEALRIEAGEPRMGAELDERTIAAEAGLVERCVSFTKGCFTGQELVARLDARGNRVARRLRLLVVHPGLVGLDEVGAIEGAELLVAGKAVGTVTSAAWSPGEASVVGLAYAHRSVEPPCEVVVRAGAMGSAGAFGGALRELPTA